MHLDDRFTEGETKFEACFAFLCFFPDNTRPAQTKGLVRSTRSATFGISRLFSDR
jgi:hypothetical protein